MWSQLIYNHPNEKKINGKNVTNKAEIKLSFNIFLLAIRTDKPQIDIINDISKLIKNMVEDNIPNRNKFIISWSL